jgi:cytochrome c oxidase subunit 2
MQSGPTGIDALVSKLNDKTIMLIPEDREKMENDLSRKTRLIRLLYQMKKHHSKKQDAYAWDDIIQKDTLYLCKNKEYEFNFRAKDVIHSAHFPHFRVQMNTVPGMTTRFKFTPDMTTKEMRKRKNDEKFNFVLLCNKICGLLINIHMEDRGKELEKKEIERSGLFKTGSKSQKLANDARDGLNTNNQTKSSQKTSL